MSSSVRGCKHLRHNLNNESSGEVPPDKSKLHNIYNPPASTNTNSTQTSIQRFNRILHTFHSYLVHTTNLRSNNTIPFPLPCNNTRSVMTSIRSRLDLTQNSFPTIHHHVIPIEAVEIILLNLQRAQIIKIYTYYVAFQWSDTYTFMF